VSSVGVYGQGTTFCGKYQNASSWSSGSASILDARIRTNGVMIAQIVATASGDSAIYVKKCVCGVGGATVTLSGTPSTPADLIVGYIYMPLIIQL
jgi:hypothetical protein